MSEALTPPPNLQALVDALDLAEVTSYEHGARRTDGAPGEEGIQIEVQTKQDDSQYETRFRMKFSGDGYEAVADIGLVFSKINEGQPVPDELAASFVEEVAIMSAYPFLRESLHASASRLGVERPVLSLIRRGQISLTPSAPTD